MAGIRLFGRVLANRLWLHHFGRGIVDTPSDFGILGQRPTHPELLDWLAGELVRQGWSLKRMHQVPHDLDGLSPIVAACDAAKDAVDSGNTLYGRYAVRRLEAEALARPHVGHIRPAGSPPRSARPCRWSRTPSVRSIVPDDKPRRGVYLQVRRSKPVAFLTAFDAPGGELNCDRRISSTAAPQALMLMNSDFVLQQAGHFARRLVERTVVQR